MAIDVFISYSHHDKKIADALCHYLEHSDIRCWIAPRDIGSGEDYGDVIENAIRDCRIFLLLFSKDSSVSPWVKGELNIAFSEEKYIAPVRIDGTELEGSNRLILNQLHWIDIFPFVESNFSVVKDSILQLLQSTDVGTSDDEDGRKGKGWDWRSLFGNLTRSLVLLLVLVATGILGRYIVCFLCSLAAQVGLWMEPLNLDTEDMHLNDTALFFWLPVSIILTLVFMAQALKRKSVKKLFHAFVCLILCAWCLAVGLNSSDYGKDYSNGYWIFEKNGDSLSEDTRYGARNMFGVVSIPAEYEEMLRFEEGYSVVKKDGYWGAIDKRQKIVVTMRYALPDPVENFLYGIPLGQ